MAVRRAAVLKAYEKFKLKRKGHLMARCPLQRSKWDMLDGAL